MAEVIHCEGWKRLILENDNSPSTRKNKGESSKRPAKMSKIRKYKRWLRSWYLKTKPNEKDGLKILYEEVKESLRNTMRMEWHLIKRRKYWLWNQKCYKNCTSQHGQQMSVHFWGLSNYLLLSRSFWHKKARFFSYWQLLTMFECFSLLAYKL